MVACRARPAKRIVPCVQSRARSRFGKLRKDYPEGSCAGVALAGFWSFVQRTPTPRAERMVSPMFEFLFKYSRATYERAELVFASGWPVWLLYALIVVAAVGVGIAIWRRRPGLGPVKATVLGALQTALIAALLVLAWRPALGTPTLR